MKKITQADLFKGRKRLKAFTERAAAQAAALRSDEEAANGLRDVLRFHAGLKTKNLDSLLICQNGEGGHVAILALKDAPRGMPNLIGAAGSHATEELAEEAGLNLLVAAHIMILDHKAELANGTADAVRRFEYGGLALGVPVEIISVIANRLPRDMTAEQKDHLRIAATTDLREMMSTVDRTEEGWAGLDDQAQVAITFVAARLLCVEVSSLHA